MRVVRVLATLTGWVLAVGCIGLLVAVGIGPRTGRYATLTVLSGSMRPAIPEGAVVVVTPQHPSQVRVGQILTFAAPEGDRRVVSHRVVKVVKGGNRPVIQTQGDANNAPDPWLAEIDDDTVWRVRYAVPGAGLMINWLRQPLVHQLTVMVVPSLLAVVWLVGIWRPAAEPSRRPATGVPA